MQRHLWLGTAVLALLIGASAPAAAQYVREYKASDKPSVEVNLDALNDKEEQEYHAEHDVASEPLPVQLAEPAPVPEPVVAEQPRPRKRLLKPILTARPPVMEQVEEQVQEEYPTPPEITREEMATPPPIVKHSIIPASEPEEVMPEVAVETPEDLSVPPPHKPNKPIKRSWSVVDGAPSPEELQTAQPAPAEIPVEMPAPVTAAAPGPEPQAPVPEPAGHIPPQPVVMQYSGIAPTVIDEKPQLQAPLPHRKPQIAVQPVVEETVVMLPPPPVIVEKTAPETEVAAEAPPASPVAQETGGMPVVPALADLTLGFNGSSSDLTADSRKKLDSIISQMADSIAGRLQVRGYAAGEDGSQPSARRIALSRALSVRSYLMDKGIKPNRVDVRALGSETDRAPVDRVDLIFAK